MRFSSAASAPSARAGLVGRVATERLDAVEDDRALGERAGLVEAHDVDARQPLDRRELLHQHLAAGEDDRRHAERDRGEQHQPLGHHPDHARDRAGDRRRDVAVLQLAPEQDRPDHQDQPGDVAQDGVDAVDELGPRHGEPARLLRDLAGVGVGADRGHLHPARARHDEAPGERRVVRVLRDRIGLAGEQRLVELEPGGVDDHAVGRELVAGAQVEDVVEDDRRDVDLLGPAVADAPGPPAR